MSQEKKSVKVTFKVIFREWILCYSVLVRVLYLNERIESNVRKNISRSEESKKKKKERKSRKDRWDI
jgi:hypothetical protein